MLKHKRYEHSLRSAQTAGELAGRYGADRDKAWIAGLLHDISREQSPDTIREWATLDKGALTSYEEAHFNVLHSYASAWYCSNKLGIDDQSVLNAIRFHTTGAAGMDLLAKVVFAADYLEPGRDHLSSRKRGELLNLSIDDLVVSVLESTRFYLESKDIPMSPDSWELYRELTKR